MSPFGVALKGEREASLLSTLNCARKIQSANETVVDVFVRCLPFRDDGTCLEVVAWSTSKHDDLKRPRLLGEESSEPVHPGVVALNKLIVQDQSRSEVLRQRQPV